MPSRRDMVLVALSALLAGALAIGLRVPVRPHAYTSDEVGHLFDGGAVAQITAEETGVNPPLFRILTAYEASPAARVERGRSLSIEASGVAAALLVVLGALVGGRWWAGLLAAAPFVLLPTPIRATQQARAYGLLAAASVAWLVAVAAWSARPEDRRRQVAVALLAVPLPWIHYVAVPWLLGTGLGVAATVPRLRRIVALLVPAAVGFLPLGWMVVTAPDRRVPPREGWDTLLDWLLSFDVASPLLPWAAPPPYRLPMNPSDTAFSVAVALCVVPWLWRRLADPVRVLWWASITGPLVLVAMNTVQMVRQPSVVLVAITVGPLLAALPSRIPSAGRSLGVAAVMTAWIAWPIVDRLQKGTFDAYRYPDALRAFAWQVRDGDLPPGDLVIHHSGMAVPFTLYAVGQLPSRLPTNGPCAGRSGCLVVADRAVMARDTLAPEARWVATFSWRPPELPTCTRWPYAPEGATVWDCGDRAGDGGRASGSPRGRLQDAERDDAP